MNKFLFSLLMASTALMFASETVVTDPCGKSDKHQKACLAFQKVIDCIKAHQASQDVSDNGFIEALVINAKCGALKDAFGAALSDVEEEDQKALAVHLAEQFEKQIE